MRSCFESEGEHFVCCCCSTLAGALGVSECELRCDLTNGNKEREKERAGESRGGGERGKKKNKNKKASKQVRGTTKPMKQQKQRNGDGSCSL